MEKEMNFYELDRTIDQLVENGFVINEETGEVVFEAPDLDKLQGELNDKINYLIGKYKNLDVTADAVKKQGETFMDRAKRYKAKADNIKKFLDYYSASKGITSTQIFDNGELSFRKSTAMNILDENKFFEWIEEHPEYREKYLEEQKPTIIKKAVSKDLKENKDLNIPGIELSFKNNIQIK